MGIVEKVARALCLANGWSPEFWRNHEHAARRAIAAMVPTEAMKSAGASAIEEAVEVSYSLAAEHAWQAMKNAALEER